MCAKTSKPGQRRSGRIRRELPIQVSGIDAMGRDFSTPTQTRMLSLHGAEILLKNELVPDQEISITLLGSTKDWDARVVGLFSKQPQGFAYGIEFLFEDGNFWGISFPSVAIAPEPPKESHSAEPKPAPKIAVDPEKLWKKKQGYVAEKHYAIRLRCPHGDAHGGPLGNDDQWVILQNRDETLAQILDAPWAFTCAIHGAQSGFPLEAKEVPTGVEVQLVSREGKGLGAFEGPKKIAHGKQNGPRARRETRQSDSVRVWVKGVDANGNPFQQSAIAIDISRNGGRLEGIGLLTNPGSTIEVKRHWRKALFRIVWAGRRGTTQANQVGIVCLEPGKNLWNFPDKN